MSLNATLLIVEDDKETRESIENLLSRTFHVLTADSGNRAIEILKHTKVDAMLVDVRMPDLDGVGLCKYVRTSDESKNVPILMVSGYGDEATRTECFLWGADDFIAKPFSSSELIARVLSKLKWNRQLKETISEKIICGNLEILERELGVRLNGARIDLTIFEFRLLKYLVDRKNTVLSRSQILTEVWKNNAVASRTIDVHIHSLRNKLKVFDHEIHTVHGAGYILRPK